MKRMSRYLFAGSGVLICFLVVLLVLLVNSARMGPAPPDVPWYRMLFARVAIGGSNLLAKYGHGENIGAELRACAYDSIDMRVCVIFDTSKLTAEEKVSLGETMSMTAAPSWETPVDFSGEDLWCVLVNKEFVGDVIEVYLHKYPRINLVEPKKDAEIPMGPPIRESR